MLNKDLELTLNIAFTDAHTKRHEFLTVEHLLLALLDNTSAATVLKGCGADINRLRGLLAQFIDETTPCLSAVDETRDTQPTIGFQRVLQRAVFHAQSSHKAEVDGASVLVAIFGEHDSQAVYFLRLENVTRLDVVHYLSHGISQGMSEFSDPNRSDPAAGLDDELGTDAAPASLESFLINLNARALQGHIDPLIGRQEELLRTIQVLCRRRKNNPLFVGEAGVGKTAIAEGLALLIAEGKAPKALAASTIYSLDLGSLLAGTKYRGDFEKRFKGVIHKLRHEAGAILFIDEIHTIIGAGAASGGILDASNMIKPLLANGELKCMGSTTYQEYRSVFEKDRALARRFQKIDVSEPSIEEAIHILQGLKTHFEEYHHIKYTQPALKAAVELSARHITDRFLPDKAIDIIDEAGAYQALQSETKRKKVIGVSEIEEIVARVARIPAKSVSLSDKERLQNLERNLKMLVYGQDEAVESLASAIKLARSGLGDAQKPVGSFLLAGPTGVGKTEVTKQLAAVLGIPLIRFDMSEYMERHTVSRLIGSPPGYVGFEQGGLLTEAINKQPHAVLLLDEIEKAHPDVFNLLLQVMDHGTLTDTNGRKSDFRHIILVMTSNAGAEVAQRTSVGFTRQDHSTDHLAAIKRGFSPEFRNRLDSIILFKSLTPEVVAHVVDKFVMELEVQLETKGVALHLEPEVRSWLAEKGYDREMGARPMARLIQEKLKKPLADELLFNRLVKGGSVDVSVLNDILVFDIKAQKKQAAAAAVQPDTTTST
jgi:ATP-dependent Clp protease ATP-binding subunit ClpA